MTEKIFVCDTKTETFSRFIETKDAFMKEFDQQTKFLEKQAKALSERHRSLWEGLWNDLVDQGLIPKTYDYKDYGMNINPESKQLFIEKCCDHKGGIADFLKHILK